MDLQSLKIRTYDKVLKEIRIWDFKDIWESQLMPDISEYEIMKFTGLSDKFGKDIYEGDLVTITDPYNDNTAKGFAIIVFSNAYVGGWVATVDYKETLNIGTRSNYIEVVGNVYENVDLVPTVVA